MPNLKSTLHTKKRWDLTKSHKITQNHTQSHTVTHSHTESHIVTHTIRTEPEIRKSWHQTTISEMPNLESTVHTKKGGGGGVCVLEQTFVAENYGTICQITRSCCWARTNVRSWDSENDLWHHTKAMLNQNRRSELRLKKQPMKLIEAVAQQENRFKWRPWY